MKDLIKRMNSVDVGALFKKKIPVNGPVGAMDPSNTAANDNQLANINWQEAPKPLVAAVAVGGLLVLYGMFNLYQLYSAHSEFSDSELRWEQASQEHLNALQQFETKVSTNRNLFDANGVFINSKSELEKNIYLFHKSAGLEIVKTNEEDVAGKKYSNYVAEGDFSAIQSVLRDMNAISIYTTINMVGVSVLPEKNKLQFQIQLNYTDITPLKKALGKSKMSYMDGGGYQSEQTQYRRVQFVPLNNSDAKPEQPKTTDVSRRDPFFKPQLKENESLTKNNSANASNMAASKEVSTQDAQEPSIILRGCITAETLRQCIYELPNKTVIFRKIGEDVATGMKQVAIARDGVKLRKGNKTLTIPVGGQVNE